MIAPELEQETINQISSLKLERYLESKGWRRQKLIADLASIWSYHKKDKKVGVLVPLHREIADFDNRMREVLTILEKVEDRPKSEILASLQNTSRIAKVQNREILEFRLRYVYEDSQEASAKKIGSVLKSLQDFLNAIGEHKVRSNRLSIRERKRLTSW